MGFYCDIKSPFGFCGDGLFFFFSLALLPFFICCWCRVVFLLFLAGGYGDGWKDWGKGIGGRDGREGDGC